MACAEQPPPQTARSVDVLVPVHNNWKLTKSGLEHLRGQTLSHTVIVADNGSTDGTTDLVRREFPEVLVTELGSNLGFPAACNRGVRAGSGEIVVLLNNDVECPPEFLERLVAPFADDERLGSVAALLLNPGGATIESFGLTVDPTLAGFPRFRGLPVGEADRMHPALIGPSGAAGAYRRRAWDEVGGLDEGVFFYGEDVDLALRLREAGWATHGAADAVAIHYGSASASHRSKWQRYQGGFARGYFLRRHGVLRGTTALRALVTEAVVVAGDSLVFSRDLAALRGRIAGWRAARGLPRSLRSARGSAPRISLLESLKLRLGTYAEREPRA